MPFLLHRMAFNAYLVRYILFEFGFYIEKGKTRRENYGQYSLAYNIVYSDYVEHCNVLAAGIIKLTGALLEEQDRQ